MGLDRKVLNITGISLMVIIGLIGCSKKTNTVSQGLDITRSQARENPSTTEKASAAHDTVVHDQSMTHDMSGNEMGGNEVALKDVYFDYDTPKIRSDMKGVLDTDASLLKDKKEVKVKIEGYCDERGTDEYNLALGNKRAYSVKRFLMAEGVDQNRLSTISYGNERPVCNDHDEKCYKLNRRAHFDVQ